MANRIISDLIATLRSFFRSGKGFEGVEGTTPVDSPDSSVRRIYPKTTGWYDQNSDGEENKFAFDYGACDEVECSVETTVTYDDMPKRLLVLPPEHRIVEVSVHVTTSMSGSDPIGDSTRGVSNTSPNATLVMKDVQIPNDSTVGAVKVYSDGSGGTIKLKLCKDVGSDFFDVTDLESFTHGGTGEETFSLAEPVTIPATGDYYIGYYTSFSPFYSTDASRVNTCRITGGDVVGTHQDISYQTDGAKASIHFGAYANIGIEGDNDAVMAAINVGTEGATLTSNAFYGSFHNPKEIIFTGPDCDAGQVEVTVTYKYQVSSFGDFIELNEIETPVDSPPDDYRRLYAKTGGWYQLTPNREEDKLALELYPCDSGSCTKAETVLYNEMPKKVFTLPPEHKITHIDVEVVDAMTGILPTGDATRGDSIGTMSNTTNVVTDLPLTADAILSSISVYSNGSSGSIKFKLCKEVDSSHFDITDLESFSHGGTGAETFVLATPVTIPSSGTYYLGFWSNFSLYYSAKSSRADATQRNSGDLSGTNQDLGYTMEGIQIRGDYASYASIGIVSDPDLLLSEIDVGTEATVSEDVDYGPFHSKKEILFTGPTATAGEVEVTCTYEYVELEAADITVDASGFSGVLSATDDDVQTALDTIDAHSHSHGNLSDIGTNTHSDIDTHISDSVIHYAYGFADRTKSTLSFDAEEMEFTISPTVTNFVIYIDGVKYTKTTESVPIPATPDLYFIYFDTDGTLTCDTSVWDFLTQVMVATVYWNGTSAFIGDDRHGTIMDRKTHEYLHETVGSRYGFGFNGTFTDTTISISSGEWYDEDIEWVIEGTTTTVPVFYKEGSAIWKWTSAQAKPYHEVSNLIQYNNGNALADVDNNKYVASWVYATNNATTPIIVIIGQRQDATIAAARANNLPENIVFGDLPALEMKLLYRLIFQRSGTSEVYIEAMDFRTVSVLPSSNYIATDHGTLTGLSDPDHPASAITVNTTGFSGNLSSADDTVQLALATIDGLDLGGGGTWGSITGTLSDQTDLDSALDGKLPTTSFSGLSKITVADAAPENPTEGDLWIDKLTDGESVGTADVVGGRVVYTSATQMNWSFKNNNQITLFDGSAWRLARLATAPSFANDFTDMTGSAAAYGYNYDVFACWDSATSMTFAFARWLGGAIDATTGWLSSSVLYRPGDRVNYSGVNYACLLEHNSEAAYRPDLDSTHWWPMTYEHLDRCDGRLVYANTGDFRKYRFIGIMRLFNVGGVAKFDDSQYRHSFCNYYNAVRRELWITVDASSYNFTGTSPVLWHNWVSPGLEILHLWENDFEVHMAHAWVTSVSDSGVYAEAVMDADTVHPVAVLGRNTEAGDNLALFTVNTPRSTGPDAGYHYLDVYVRQAFATANQSQQKDCTLTATVWR